MKTKKICFVTTTSITVKTFLIGQMEYLSSKGYEVSVICSFDEDLLKSLPENINYIPVNMSRGVKLSEPFKCIFQLYRIFRRDCYDIVQYSTPNAALYTSIAAWLAKVPVRLYCQWGIRYVGFTGWKRQLFKMIEKTVCSLSTYIEPDSKSNLIFSHKEKLYKTGKSGVVWNGSANGVDLATFDYTRKKQWKEKIREKYDIPSDDFVIGFIGRLDKDKGINELLEAFRSILSHYPTCKLFIIGSDDKNDGLNKDLFKWSESCNSVIYTGYTNQVEKYLASLDLFVLPSYREGFGSVVIEAEAMGVPVVVTDIPGPVDAMQDGVTGLTVPKAAVQPLITAIEHLIKNPQVREEMGNNAVKFARGNFNQKELWRLLENDKDRLMGTHFSSKKEQMNA